MEDKVLEDRNESPSSDFSIAINPSELFYWQKGGTVCLNKP